MRLSFKNKSTPENIRVKITAKNNSSIKLIGDVTAPGNNPTMVLNGGELIFCLAPVISPGIWILNSDFNVKDGVSTYTAYKTIRSTKYFSHGQIPTSEVGSVNLVTYLTPQFEDNIVVVEEKGIKQEHVKVTQYTSSALDFEHGIIDKIPNVTWFTSGIASANIKNKIYSTSSFETKAIGDSLYTNSNLLTGGNTPFTIEFYALISGTAQPTSSSYMPIIIKKNSTSNTTILGRHRVNGNLLYYQNYPIEDIQMSAKIFINEINKITITYDTSCLRFFINDQLESVVGKTYQPFTSFGEGYYFLSGDEDGRINKGLLDNINIFNGIATKVRNADPYEDKLVVDLAFDGENNSTKIADNGTLKSNWTVNGNAKISTDQKFDGFSSFNVINSTLGNDYIILNQNISLSNTDFTIELDFLLSAFVNDYSSVLVASKLSNGVSGSAIAIAGVSENRVIRVNFNALNYEPNNILTGTIPIEINKKYKLNIVVKDSICYLYINGLLNTSKAINTSIIQFTLGDGLVIGRGGTLSNSNPTINIWESSLNGYIKNFKIYKGVAIIPESPLGKIQLDFDNNVNDKYNNSTWTNNGVTFDRVNSVKGHAAYFNSGERLTSTANNNLNFENKNYSLSFDTKLSSINTWNDFIYSGVPGSSNGLFYSSSGLIRHRFNGSLYYEFKINLLASQYYRFNQIRANNAFVTYINDVVVSTYNSSETMNLNLSNTTYIGSGANGAEYITGYIDNFKSYKEDLVNMSTSIYGKLNNISIINNILNMHSSEVSPYNTLRLDDSPMLNDFIAEIETIVNSGNVNYASIVCRTNDYTLNNMDKFGYVAYITGDLIRFGKGSNNNVSGWTKLGEHNIPVADGKIHKLKLIANGSNFKIFYDDVMVIEVNDTTHTKVSNFGIVTYYFNSSITSQIKSYKISDLSGTELYYKDWKTKIESDITNAAVHLPLETNAINTGFTPLTINSIGSPTYTTVDGKKCIKFERGRYLTINSNNIFNLGNSSDFYIEFDFYVSDATKFHTLLSSGNSSDTSLRSLLAVSPAGGLDNKVYFRQLTPKNITLISKSKTNFGVFNNLIFKRQGNKVSLVLNGEVSEVLDVDVDFSSVLTLLGNSNFISTNYMNGYMSNFKMFVGTSEIPKSFNDKKVLDLDFKPTRKSYLFKDNNNKCVIHPVNITQRDYQDSKYCCYFNGTNQHLELGKNEILNFGMDDFILKIQLKPIFNTLTVNNYARVISPYWGDMIKEYIMVPNDNYSNINFRGTLMVVLDETSRIFMNTPRLSDTKVNSVILQRINNKFILYLNEIVVEEKTYTGDFNLNRFSNTIIGAAKRTTGVQDHFLGTIYSIKALRNTSDTSLLEDVWVDPFPPDPVEPYDPNVLNFTQLSSESNTAVMNFEQPRN